MRRTLRLMLVVLGLAVVASTICGTRWVLGWDDLPAYARPAGYHEIGHRYDCTGNGDCLTIFGHNCDAYCFHEWLYVSDEVDYDTAIAELTSRFQMNGWVTQAIGGPVMPDGGVVASMGTPQHWKKCFAYTNYQQRSSLGIREELYEGHRGAVESARSAILITTGCG